MSIKGIDSQIMITRAPDFVNEAASQLRSGDRMQDFLAVQNKAEAEHDKSSIAKTEESPKSELHTENEGGTQDSYTPSKKHGQKQAGRDASMLDSDVGASENIIDILL